MLRQQIIGVINLSIPLIILYNTHAPFITTVPGKIFCGILIGLYVMYVAWQQVKNLEKSLQYSPSDLHKMYFENLISECNIDPEAIVLRYAYAHEMIAMTAGKTVIIDPVVWHDVEKDMQAMQVLMIFKQHVEPNLPLLTRQRLAAVRSILTPKAQRFILKHEIAHVVHYFSYIKLGVMFLVAALATYIGLYTAQCLMTIHGLLAIAGGMIVGGMADLLLTYVSNYCWKMREEMRADAFAVRYSNQDDIQAAAEFFKQHQEIIDTYKKSHFLTSLFPLSITAGYQDGYSRSQYILKLFAQKYQL